MSLQPKPIIMSTPMVLSLNDDAKTQTRRTSGLEGFSRAAVVAGYETKGRDFFARITQPDRRGDPWEAMVKCRYGGPGGQLYVREGVRRKPADPNDRGCCAEYIADRAPAPCDTWGWKNPALPAIHMPSGMCRHRLELIEIRIERVQSISESDARAEGIRSSGPGVFFWPGADRNYATAVAAYMHGWVWLNGQGSWDLNPLVWVLSFKQVLR